MEKSKKSYFTHSSFGLLLIILIAVFLNILLDQTVFKLDLTENKQFTLAESSRSAIAGLDEPLTIKAFFSAELPQELALVRQDVDDILQEYQSLDKSKVIVEKIDPKSDPQEAEEAQSYNIPEIQFNILGSQKFEVSTGYAGLALIYKDKVETLPLIQDTNNLEYDLTAAIIRMTSEQLPKIGFTISRGELTLQQLKQALAKYYDLVDIDTKLGQALPDDLQALVIAGPSQEFEDQDLFVIDQYLMNGGRIMVLLDGMVASAQTMSASPNETGLNRILEKYGFRVNYDLAADLSSNKTVTFGGSGMAVVRPYALWPVIIKSGFDQENPISSRLESLTFPWVSSVSVLDERDKTVSRLARTSPNTLLLNQELVSLNPDDLTGNSQSLQSATVVALASGKFESYFKDKEIPVLEGQSLASQKVDETENASLLIVGDADFINEQSVEQTPENLVFFANAIDHLVQNDSLISIRSRNIQDRPLIPLDEKQKALIKYGNIGVSVLLLAATALLSIIWRKRTAQKAKQFYG